MYWSLAGFVIACGILVALLVWRNWIAPWQRIEEMIQEIALARKPRSFLVKAGAGPRRAGLLLEELFKRHQQLEQQISERTIGTETILAAMQDGLLVVDAGHRIALFNGTFQELFGLRSNSVGEPLLDVVRGADLDQLITTTLRTKTAQRTELSLPDPQTAVPRQLQLSAVPMKNETGQASGAVVVFHDITQLKQTDEIRRDFVANVSHELRTPLSILRGYIETLRDNLRTSPVELARILEVMERHSRRLNALVDDLLTLAQLESTNPNLQLSEVRIGEVFAAIVRDWAKKFGEKKLGVDIDLAPNLPTLRADETRLQEILYNLLDNALKYSRPGDRIRLQARKSGAEMALSVSDTGIGISEQDLPRIFERFYRTDKARSREMGGTGLGLSIVKHIAQMHGGRVEAESQLGQGTTIRVLLPMEIPSKTDGVTES